MAWTGTFLRFKESRRASPAYELKYGTILKDNFITTAQQPKSGFDRFIVEVSRSHTTEGCETSERVIIPS
jgi:hypothetical protein